MGWGAAVSQLLARLAKRQSLDPREYLYYQPSRDPVTHATTCAAIICDSRMVTLRANGTEYGLAIQGADSCCTDGIRGEQIVLLEPRGKLLDRIQCSILKSPLGRENLSVEIHQAPQVDGAQVIIRFVGRSVSFRGGKEIPAWFHNYHSILYHGRDYSFWTDDRILKTEKRLEPDVWSKKGLCRAKILDGKLSIIFPRLEQPEDQMLAARSLRVKYHSEHNPDGWTSAVFDDREEVKNLVSAISVRATGQLTGGTGEVKDLASAISVRRLVQPIAEIGDYRSNAIQLLLPSGGAMIITFDTPTNLTLEGWGHIELSSRGFYDKLCGLLTKREGRPVKLADADDAKP